MHSANIVFIQEKTTKPSTFDAETPDTLQEKTALKCFSCAKALMKL